MLQPEALTMDENLDIPNMGDAFGDWFTVKSCTFETESAW